MILVLAGGNIHHERPLSLIRAALAAVRFGRLKALYKLPRGHFSSVPMDMTSIEGGGESDGTDRLPLLAAVSYDKLMPALYTRQGRQAEEAVTLNRRQSNLGEKTAYPIILILHNLFHRKSRKAEEKNADIGALGSCALLVSKNIELRVIHSRPDIFYCPF